MKRLSPIVIGLVAVTAALLMIRNNEEQPDAAEEWKPVRPS